MDWSDERKNKRRKRLSMTNLRRQDKHENQRRRRLSKANLLRRGEGWAGRTSGEEEEEAGQWKVLICEEEEDDTEQDNYLGRLEEGGTARHLT